MNSSRNIQRVDHGYSHCWRVILGRGKDYQVIKIFSDNVHGGSLKALDVAKEWRDKTEKELGLNDR